MANIRRQSGTNTVKPSRRSRAAWEINTTLPPGCDLRSCAPLRVHRGLHPQRKEHLIIGLFSWPPSSALPDEHAMTVTPQSRSPLQSSRRSAPSGYMTSLNMLMMPAPTRCIGIVIDDAIVVLENIYRPIERSTRIPSPPPSGHKEIGSVVGPRCCWSPFSSRLAS